MKVIILCGGKGLRMDSSTARLPKPLIEVQGKPLLWHIMKIYSHYGYNEFVLPLGFRGDAIKQFFLNYHLLYSNYTQDLKNNTFTIFQEIEDWKITFVDTGIDTMTGSRIKKVMPYIDGDQFMVTYGDGLSDINIQHLVEYHNHKQKLVTVTGVSKNSPFGSMSVHDGIVTEFKEKTLDEHIINGGFFVCQRGFFDYLDSTGHCVLEESPMQRLVQDEELAVYRHPGYWIGVDSPKEVELANSDWRIEEILKK